MHIFFLPGMNNREVLEQVERGYRMPRPRHPNPKPGLEYIPEPFYDMLLKCWAHQADARPTFEFLHDFFDTFGVSSERDYREAK